jgi:hypothetical protein
MSENDPQSGSITSEEIDAFGRRLAEWGETLEPNERALALMLVERLREIEPNNIVREELRIGVAGAVRAVVEAINERWSDGDVWVKMGPLWLKSNTVEVGEEVEITQRVYTREQQ